MYIPTDIVNLILSYSPYWIDEHKRKMIESLIFIEKYNWSHFYYMKYQKSIVYTFKCDICKKIFCVNTDSSLCLPCVMFLKEGYTDTSTPFL